MNHWQMQFVHTVKANLAFWHEQMDKSKTAEAASWVAKPSLFHRAVDVGLRYEETDTSTIELMLLLFPLIEQSGLWHEWEPLFKRAIARKVTPWQQYHLLVRHGQLLRSQDQYELALQQHRQAKIIAEALGDTLLIAQAHFNLSATHYNQHNYTLAEHNGVQAIQQFSDIQAEPRYLAATLMTLGLTAEAQGRYPIARQRLEEATAYWRQTARPISLARALNALANVLQTSQVYDIALHCYNEALAILEETSSSYDKILTYNSKGTLLFNLNKFDEAIRTFWRAYHLSITHSGFNYYTAIILMNLANIGLVQKKLTSAKERIEQSLRIWEQLKENNMLYGNTLSICGEIELALGNQSHATRYFKEALTIFSAFPQNAIAQRWYQNTKQLLDE